jgi:DNA helicase-2/ATP-dependent DNA helicase PcrA
MKERIGGLVGKDLARHLWMGTFHSIFARILRLEGHHLGYPASYTIYDTTDSRSLVKKIIKELDLNDQVYKPAEVHGRISTAKNNLITPAIYFSSAQLLEQDKRTRRPRLADIYKLYAIRCKQSDAMDFDDLLLNMHILIRDFPQILDKYQDHFSYILVDEYQDTNYVQYRIVQQLAGKNKNICVVGDDAQSIYSFRGARIENILNFKHDYPGYLLFKLERNYRSTQNIVNAANSVITRNRDRISKQVYSRKEEGQKIHLVRAATDTEEGFLVAGLIQEAVFAEQLKFLDISIMYRTNAQSRIFEEALRKLNIPYKVFGSLSFYQRKEIKDLLGYFRLTVNPHDEEALRRIINYPARGIGNTTLSRLEQRAASKDRRIWDVLMEIDAHSDLFNKGTLRKLKSFTSLITGFHNRLKTMEAFDLAYIIAESSGILKDLHYENSPENLSKYENLQEILNGIKEFTETREEGQSTSLDAFLQSVALLTDADNEKDEDRNKVSIMTIHAAKGLEFKNVYVTGLEEELFPSRMSSSTREELEEERRLFYVALTRAMNKVTLSFASSRYRWGIPVNGTPSRFIREIDIRFIANPIEEGSPSPPSMDINGKLPSPTHTRRMKPVSQLPRQSSGQDVFESDDPGRIQTGMEVLHSRFGKGKVLNLDGELPNRKATVFFNDHGQKQLLLKFAKLKILDD